MWTRVCLRDNRSPLFARCSTFRAARATPCISRRKRRESSSLNLKLLDFVQSMCLSSLCVLAYGSKKQFTCSESHTHCTGNSTDILKLFLHHPNKLIDSVKKKEKKTALQLQYFPPILPLFFSLSLFSHFFFKFAIGRLWLSPWQIAEFLLQKKKRETRWRVSNLVLQQLSAESVSRTKASYNIHLKRGETLQNKEQSEDSKRQDVLFLCLAWVEKYFSLCCRLWLTSLFYMLFPRLTQTEQRLANHAWVLSVCALHYALSSHSSELMPRKW